MGFTETSPADVRKNIVIDGDRMKSRVNGREVTYGHFETVSLSELRTSLADLIEERGQIRVSEVVAGVQELHCDPKNAGSLFQVASQFNTLEMISPSVVPEEGVGIYENDNTQGPACAIAAGAGTIFRNYFAPVNGAIGQSTENQIDCLMDLGKALGNTNQGLWAMRNGYLQPSKQGLQKIATQIGSMSEQDKDVLRGHLSVGIQRNTQVTMGDCQHTVSQVYGSALPVAYFPHTDDLWAPFAKLVLEASYEATLCAAVLNRMVTKQNRVFLTLLGGGAFGNRADWILAALERTLIMFKHRDLDVSIVSYMSTNRGVKDLVDRYRG